MKLHRILILLCFSGYVSSASAELRVIADLGGQSTEPFYQGINSDKEKTTAAAEPRIPQNVTLADMLPVTTPEMSPGMVIDRPLNLPGAGALFLVGDDDISRAWLKNNVKLLINKHAAGLIVNVKDISGVNRLRDLVPGIPLAPASGSELAHRLQLQHYPVLITDTGLYSLQKSELHR